jgi:hypothetical protein
MCYRVATSIILTCSKTKNWSRKWLVVNEQGAYKKSVNRTNDAELTNIGKFFYRTKYKWENTFRNTDLKMGRMFRIIVM